MTEPVASVGSASARAAAGSGELRPGGMRLGAVLLAVALLVGTLAAAAALVTNSITRCDTVLVQGGL